MVFIQVERTLEIAIVISGLTITKTMIIVISLEDIRMTGIGDILNTIIMGQIITTMKINTIIGTTMMSTSIEGTDQNIITMMMEGMIEAGERGKNLDFLNLFLFHFLINYSRFKGYP